MQIRTATASDAETISGHRDRMFLDMGIDPAVVTAASDPALRWIRAALADGRYLGWLATEDSGVVGGVGLTFLDLPPNMHTVNDQRGYLLNMFVEPAFRGQGIARTLVDRALAECRARGIDAVTLHASDAGRPLYESLGFTPTNEMRLRQS